MNLTVTTLCKHGCYRIHQNGASSTLQFDSPAFAPLLLCLCINLKEKHFAHVQSVTLIDDKRNRLRLSYIKRNFPWTSFWALSFMSHCRSSRYLLSHSVNQDAVRLVWSVCMPAIFKHFSSHGSIFLQGINYRCNYGEHGELWCTRTVSADQVGKAFPVYSGQSPLWRLRLWRIALSYSPFRKKLSMHHLSRAIFLKLKKKLIFFGKPLDYGKHNG